MAEPSTEVFHGNTTSNLIKTHIAATRPAFFTASILPVITALAYVWSQTGGLDIGLSLLILISITCVHAAANVLNDYFDSRNGTDEKNTSRVYPFSGGSRFIQNGVMSEGQMLRLGLYLLALGIVSGLIVVFSSGPWLWLIGLTGVVLAYFYSAPPCLACLGLGDITIATCFGVLPVVGTVYSLTGFIDLNALWTGLVIGCFVAAILWINSIPDIDADRAAGKMTVPGRLKARLASRMHGLWFAAGFGLILLTPIAEWGLVALVGVIPAAIATVAALRGQMIPAMPMTIITHAIVCILLALGFVLF